MAARRGKRQAKRNTDTGTPGWVWLIAIAAVAAVVFMAAPSLFKQGDDGFLRAGPRANPDAVPAPVADADIDAPASLPRPAATRPAAEATRPAPTQYDFYTLLPGSEVQMSDAELAATARAEAERQARAEREAARAAGTSVPAPLPEVTTPPPSEAQRALAALEGRPLPAPQPAAPAPLRETRPASTPVERAAPAVASTTAASAPAASSEPARSVRYLLQAGAFAASSDAEATKARLAMAGLAARVEPAQINGNTVYRVRVGPYGSASDLSAAKSKLEAAGLQAMAIKAQ